MSDLLTKVLPLALGAAVSPTSLAAILVVLSGKRPIARGLAFLIAWLGILGGLTALGLFGVRQTTPSPAADEITHVVDGMAGALLLVLALGTVLRAVLRDPASPPSETHTDPDRQPGLAGAFILGLAMMATNLTTILLYLPAMHAVSAAHVAATDEVLAVAIAFVITSLPVTLPFLFRVVVPGVAARGFGQLHAFIARYTTQIGVTMELVFGVWLVVKALR